MIVTPRNAARLILASVVSSGLEHSRVWNCPDRRIYVNSELVEAISDSDHPEHASMRAWFEEYGGEASARYFDRAFIDVEKLDSDVQDAVHDLR